MTIRRAICCHCPVRCGVLVDVDAHGDPVSIRGDPDHPVNKGFICPKGSAAVEYFHHPGRLDRPLRRVGARGAGRWEVVGWDEALDQIAEKLLSIRAGSGAEAVAWLMGTFHSPDLHFGLRLMNHLGSPNSGGTGLMCGGPRVAAQALTFGFAPVAPDVVPGVSKTIVLWGSHPSASGPLLWGKVREAVRQGAKLVVIDPKPTAEARQGALWLAPRPGTDAALGLAMVGVILTEGLWDRPFVERWAVGLTELRQRTAACSPEWAESMSGVPADAIRQAARLYAGAPAATLITGWPNGMGRNALDYERCMAILMALSGNLDRPGGQRITGFRPAGTGDRVGYEEYAALPFQQRAKRLGADRFRLHHEGFELLSSAARRVWHDREYPYAASYLAVAHPPSIFRAILSGQPYPVRALIAQYNNVLGAYPNTALVHRALRSDRLELFVAHELFMTPTAMLADYVLPAASWMEKPFLHLSNVREPVRAAGRVTQPRAERRSDYDFCRDLGTRLGQPWPDTLEEVWDGWLRDFGTSHADLMRAAPPSIAPAPHVPRHEEIDPRTDAPFGFATLSGKVELASSLLERLGYDPLPTFVPPEASDEYPVHLMTGGTRIDATHQDHRQIPSLRARHPDPLLEMGPELAAAIGATQGDWVRIETRSGSIRQRARIVPGMPADRVSAERWWYPEEEGSEPSLFGVFRSNVNAYTDDDPDLCDPAYGSLPFRVASCRLSKDATGPPSS